MTEPSANEKFPHDLPISFNLGVTLDLERQALWEKHADASPDDQFAAWVDLLGRHAMRTAYAVRDLEAQLRDLRRRVDGT